MEAFISGAWSKPTGGEILIGGAWRKITRAEVYIGGTWRTCLSFAPPFSVAASPSSVSGIATPTKPMRVNVTSQATQATPTGGAAPYSYAWSITSGSATITAPANALTAFRQSLAPDEDTEGTAQVVCTDSQGNTATSNVGYYLYNRSLQ